ncbi:uncharacterized protein GGS22DRAFT_173657 [Annulohypoxylon maeteangense]|uniref:uncharacterized protein n=1 Tax=Annulohypoxylon maeteangense TaxID=1927788 RepID=UPI002008BD18|nr:uncharacterized protein GGS22DRAFT_173657 [Annulohypoxylon maeteangense]KAI0880870.1 hypothetical protein GGS22DRAFT_173657 [Annulohypoxylon maeteangense]
MSREPSVKDGKKPAQEPCDQSPEINGHTTLLQHQTAIAALASLPLKTVISVFRHQWHKDKARLTFAHAEQYIHEYDLPTPKTEWPNLNKYRPRHYEVHSFQLRQLKEDLVWHREKFIRLYLDSLIASTRLPKKDPVTQSQIRSIRKSFTSELRISLPKDLAKVYYGKVPACMDAAIDPGEFKDLVDHFGAERHPMILAVPMTLHLWSVHQDYPDLLPKNPAPWDWTMPADVIEANHWKTKEDLF